MAQEEAATTGEQTATQDETSSAPEGWDAFMAPAAAVDTDADQQPEAIVLDANADGEPDIALLDTNEDANVDVIALDTNTDGVPDTLVPAEPVGETPGTPADSGWPQGPMDYVADPEGADADGVITPEELAAAQDEHEEIMQNLEAIS